MPLPRASFFFLFVFYLKTVDLLQILVMLLKETMKRNSSLLDERETYFILQEISCKWTISQNDSSLGYRYEKNTKDFQSSRVGTWKSCWLFLHPLPSNCYFIVFFSHGCDQCHCKPFDTCWVAKPLNWSEAVGDLVIILSFICNLLSSGLFHNIVTFGFEHEVHNNCIKFYFPVLFPQPHMAGELFVNRS